MDKPCVWFYVYVKKLDVDGWYCIAKYRSFASACRSAERFLDMYSPILLRFKFEKVSFLNGTIVNREFIA